MIIQYSTGILLGNGEMSIAVVVSGGDGGVIARTLTTRSFFAFRLLVLPDSLRTMP